MAFRHASEECTKDPVLHIFWNTGSLIGHGNTNMPRFETDDLPLETAHRQGYAFTSTIEIKGAHFKG